MQKEVIESVGETEFFLVREELVENLLLYTRLIISEKA